MPLGNVGATGSITGVNPACPGTTQSYSIPAVTNATAYNWTWFRFRCNAYCHNGEPVHSLVFGPSATGGTLTVTPAMLVEVGSLSNLSITVTSVATATISYPLPTYCSNASGSVSVTRTGPAGGAYSTSPATGLTINTSTGAITPSSSTAGTYTVIYTYNSGSCSSITATTTVTISVPSHCYSQCQSCHYLYRRFFTIECNSQFFIKLYRFIHCAQQPGPFRLTDHIVEYDNR